MTSPHFNPRSPNGLRQTSDIFVLKIVSISIHAARMGCDLPPNLDKTARYYFNPRSPNGLRPVTSPTFWLQARYFNPRSPNGLRLFCTLPKCFIYGFQSTQPEWAATVACCMLVLYLSFQSTQPEWAATYHLNFCPQQAQCGFQSTQPEWAATIIICFYICYICNFNPRSPNGLRPTRLGHLI